MSLRSRRGKSAAAVPSFSPDDAAALQAVRNALLHHHRALLELAQRDYERAAGRVSPTELVGLLMQHPAFGWLRMLSSLIARLDEILDQPEPGEAEAVIATASRLLLDLDANDGGFQARYREALQQSPDVVLSHARVAKLLRGLRTTRFAVVGAQPRPS
jgi:hypothetical protein